MKTTTRDAFGITEWELSNGAEVILKPTTFKQDEVLFRAISPGGTSLASDQDYVPAMTASQVIRAGGVGPFDVIQLRNLLSGKAASVTAFIDETDEGLSGRRVAKGPGDDVPVDLPEHDPATRRSDGLRDDRRRR